MGASALSSSDCAGGFPSYASWTVEFYFRLPQAPTSGYVDIITDGGDDFWITATASGTDITVEFNIREGDSFAVDPTFYGSIATFSGIVPNDGCWHQVIAASDLSDSDIISFTLDGFEVGFNNAFMPYDFTGGCWPSAFRFGAFTGTTGMVVDLTHLVLYDSYEAGNAATERYALFDGCCVVTGKPHLRQRQRNDNFNAPRFRGPVNNPSSRQKSLRRSPGSNTYLRTKREEILAGCGCKS